MDGLLVGLRPPRCQRHLDQMGDSQAVSTSFRRRRSEGSFLRSRLWRSEGSFLRSRLCSDKWCCGGSGENTVYQGIVRPWLQRNDFPLRLTAVDAELNGAGCDIYSRQNYRETNGKQMNFINVSFVSCVTCSSHVYGGKVSHFQKTECKWP